MKNSQYTNQMNISIGEVARLIFNEVNPSNNEVEHIITLSANIEFLKVVHSTIGETLSKYAENVANMHSNKGVN